MRTKSRTISVASVLLVSVTIGCSGYQNYGQPGYYGYGQPVYTAPGGSYVAPGTLTPVPPAGGGTFVAPNDPQARNIGIGGDAPSFDPATDVTPGPGDNLVPEYNDPGELDSMSGDDGFGDDGFDTPSFEGDSDFDDDFERGNRGSGGFDEFEDDGFGDFDETSSRLPLPYADPADGQLGASDSFDDADFEQPVSIDARTLQPTSFETRKAPATETSARTTRPNPYDHDKKGFRWIRGVVDHDETTGTWNVIYSLRPGRDDEFGGSLTVVGDETALEALESGTVVLAQGQVDRATKDDLGKPVYRFETLSELVPRD